MKKVILFLLLTVPVYAGDYDFQTYNALDDINREQKRHDQAEELYQIMDSEPRSVTHEVVINDAGDGCHWAQYVFDDGTARTMDSQDGFRHKLYVKVCEDDPPLDK